MNFSYKASLNFPLYPQLFNCHHESSRFNAGRQSSSLLMQRLMALHKEVQTHELSTGLSFFQSLLPRAVCEAGTHTHTHTSTHGRSGASPPGGEGQQPAAFLWGCFPLDLQCTEWQQLSQLLLLCAEQSQSRWCSGLIPGAVLSNLRNAF